MLEVNTLNLPHLTGVLCETVRPRKEFGNDVDRFAKRTGVSQQGVRPRTRRRSVGSHSSEHQQLCKGEQE